MRKRSLPHRTHRASRTLLCSLALGMLGAATTTACSNGAQPPADVVTMPDLVEPQPVAFNAPEPRLRRLTRSQYRNILRDTFGEALVLPRALEPDTTSEGSTAIGASITSISPRGVEQYQSAAYDTAEQLLRDPARRTAMLECSPSGVTDPACAERFVRSVGRRLYRRPLTTDEATALTNIANQAATALMDFHRGLEYALAAMLQAPDFLFRTELGEPDPARPGAHRFTAHEFASRLSFFLWDSAPDDALLDAAADGTLDRPDGVRTQVQRMLESPRARRGLAAFMTDWLQLTRLDTITKDPLVFPTYAPDLGPAAREEVLRTSEWLVFERDADFRELITTRDRFVNRRLAALYSVQFPLRDAAPTLFAQVTMPENSPRRGLLGSVAVLALNAHETSTSPTLRGLFVRGTLLCGSIPSPPVDVDTAIPEPSETARTLRERVAQHATNESCRACHSLMDPIGLGLEHFDGIGRYRTLDNEVAIDSSGRLGSRDFTDAVGLADAVHDSAQLPRCIVSRVYRYAHGRVETEGEQAEVGRLQDWFAWRGYRLRALLGEIATAPSFRASAPVTVGGM